MHDSQRRIPRAHRETRCLLKSTSNDANHYGFAEIDLDDRDSNGEADAKCILVGLSKYA